MTLALCLVLESSCENNRPNALRKEMHRRKQYVNKLYRILRHEKQWDTFFLGYNFSQIIKISKSLTRDWRRVLWWFGLYKKVIRVYRVYLRLVVKPWPLWLSWLGIIPTNQKVMGSITNWGTCLGCQFHPQLGCIQRINRLMFLSHIDVSLLLYLPPYPYK